VADRGLRMAEDVIYFLAALLLIACALMVLGKAAYDLSKVAEKGIKDVVTTVLDTLLLGFILVELLGAVKATMKERKLIAEPFLVVGIIASIKEIILIGSEVDFTRQEAQFENAMIQIGILGALVVALSLATLLLRRKEREPKE
jgi:uncharacterized membrane protein (DUF373 family)